MPLYTNRTCIIHESCHRSTTTSPTIARWLKIVIEAAGIDTSILKAHSVSTSTAATQGVTTEDILSAADWSTESSFQRFCYKSICDKTFAKSVLTATNNTIDMWDWAFWNIITDWLRPRSSWMLFWIIWKWSRAYQWFPTHPHQYILVDMQDLHSVLLSIVLRGGLIC